METYVFVYGTLKMGYFNNSFLGSSEFIKNYKTLPIYTMVDAGQFPIVIRGGNTSIEGEIFKITNLNVLKNIYRLEGFSGTKGSPENFYDIDYVNMSSDKQAIIFVMNDNRANLPIIPSGIF